jgi:2-polyprenyl-3-methyl-5-hydroxy-6-metoxy-1,4-benzoquinol methylase
VNTKSHWAQVYQAKSASEVSWYQEHPDLSLAYIELAQISYDAAIIDVGAGSSTLVDHLVASGYKDVTLLDLSEAALDTTRTRIGATSARLTWLVDDITSISLARHRYDLWHDRAVLHFLIDPAQRERYVAQVSHAVKPGGHVIIATFALDGPDKCSGLMTARYDAASLHSAFGSQFDLIDSTNETHKTPWGTEQRFVYCYCRKTAISMEPFVSEHV